MTKPPNEPKHTLTRRQVLKVGAGAALAVAGLSSFGCGIHAEPARPQGGRLPDVPAGLVNPSDFSFVHITDTHIQPELGAPRAVAKVIQDIHNLPEKPAFALHGGDLVFDTSHHDKARADLLYGMWPGDAKSLAMPVYYCIGNHDIYGEDQIASGATDPDLGKGMWKRCLAYASTCNTFDCAGWRFIILDSIQVSPKGEFTAAIDEPQMQWLADLLQKTPRSMPIVILTHVPMFSDFDTITGQPSQMSGFMVCINADDFHKLIKPYNVKIVLAGHTHTWEDIQHDGIRYVCGGTVCGDMWHHRRKGIAPNGFGVLTAKNGEISYRYVEYGWTPVSS